MLIKLIADNSTTKVVYNTVDRDAIKGLNKMIRGIVSYTVPSAEWSDKFKIGVWDGTISLYDGKNQEFPSGLTDLVLEKLTENGIECDWEDKRNFPWENANYTADYGGRSLRDYQIESADKIKKYSRGIVYLATGAGKSLAMCEMLTKLRCKPVTVIVPSISLLKQTADEIERTILEDGKPIKIGRVGGGFHDPKLDSINVCTYQSALAAYNVSWLVSKNKIVENNQAEDKIKKSIPELEQELSLARKAKKLKTVKKIEDQIIQKREILDYKQRTQQLLETSQVLIVDECHLAAEIIEFISKKSKNAYYKVGLSGTPWRESNDEIRIEGALGRILIRVKSSELIRRKILCKPTILMYKNTSDYYSKGYQESYSNNIVNSEYRNHLISRLATETFEHGIPTVILVERIEHGKILEQMIDGALFVPGASKGEDDPDDAEKDYRKRTLNKLANNELILIATQWIYTGVDCPPIQHLMLAGSSSSSITTYQQVGRALRNHPGKDFCIISDFYDTNKYLKSHSAQRKKTYKLEEEFDFKVVQP